MGAVAGYLTARIGRKSEFEVLSNMLKVVQHRAPYHKLFCDNENVAFGVGFNTPNHEFAVTAYDESLDIRVTIDGEIYAHFKDSGLKQGLFSDAQTVLDLYKRYGEEFPEKIDGSYSVVVYDGTAKKLLLLRDRYGTKPLFYSDRKDLFIFASEIKSILESGICERSISLPAINLFLSFGYVPNPDTMFASVQQVRPGHILIFKAGKPIEKEYWRFKYNQDEQPASDEYYIKKFRDVFKTAVSRRVSRHPGAGAFLSGGLDTSGVAVMMHKVKGRPFKAFTTGFREEAYNEIKDAKILVDHLGLEHYTTLIDFDEDFPQLLEKIVWHHDMPFADTSAIPSYYAAELAREHVDTVLSGDFPDQLIGGSGHQVMAIVRDENDSIFTKIIRNRKLNELVTSIPWKSGGINFFDKSKRFIYRETFSLEDQRIILDMPIPPLLKRCIYSHDLLVINNKYDAMEVARRLYKEVENESLLDRLLYFDIYSYAPDDLMVKVDRMTAAHGLNAISPFHDRELVEFIATVPSHIKIRGENRKYIMREALRPMLPEQTINKKKQGFAMPIGEWLVRQLSDYVRDVLLDSRTLNRGYFNKKFMKTMVEDFLEGKTDYASGSEATIISLITLELWHRMFIDPN